MTITSIAKTAKPIKNPIILILQNKANDSYYNQFYRTKSRFFWLFSVRYKKFRLHQWREDSQNIGNNMFDGIACTVFQCYFL
jgi:hypothetical protein